MKNRILILLTTLLIIGGCIKTGSPDLTRQDLIDQIKVGVTTRGQIEDWFGEGKKHYINASPSWSYTYAYYNGFTGKSIATSLSIAYNKDGTVNNFSYAPPNNY